MLQNSDYLVLDSRKVNKKEREKYVVVLYLFLFSVLSDNITKRDIRAKAKIILSKTTAKAFYG